MAPTDKNSYLFPGMAAPSTRPRLWVESSSKSSAVSNLGALTLSLRLGCLRRMYKMFYIQYKI